MFLPLHSRVKVLILQHSVIFYRQIIERLCVCYRHLLHRCVQAVIDAGTKLSSLLAYSYNQYLQSFNSCSMSAAVSDRLITVGFALGNGLILV